MGRGDSGDAGNDYVYHSLGGGGSGDGTTGKHTLIGKTGGGGMRVSFVTEGRSVARSEAKRRVEGYIHGLVTCVRPLYCCSFTPPHLTLYAFFVFSGTKSLMSEAGAKESKGSALLLEPAEGVLGFWRGGLRVRFAPCEVGGEKRPKREIAKGGGRVRLVVALRVLYSSR